MQTLQITITNESKAVFFLELLQVFQDAGWLVVKAVDEKEITQEEFNRILHEEKLRQARKLLEC